MGRCMSPKGSRTVLSGGKGGDNIKTLPIAIVSQNRRYGGDVLGWTFEKNKHYSHYPVLCTA